MDATLTVTPADAEQAVAAIVLAFTADPASRWTYPNPQAYLTHFPAFVRAFGGRAFAHGTADQVGGDQAGSDQAGSDQVAGGVGAALWLPPGVSPDEEALGAILERSVPGEVLAVANAMFERMASYHPAEPHWYLPLIGVDPAHQRKGYGSALLRHALARCDRDRVPAYLESTDRANIPLYERHGFTVLDTIQVGASPPLFPMLRAARRA